MLFSWLLDLALLVFWTCGQTVALSKITNDRTCFNRSSHSTGFKTICATVVRSPGGINWRNSEKACQDKEKGHLISITTDEENQLIFNLIGTTTEVCWIGLKTCRNYSWADGTINSYVHWNSGQPSGDGCCTELNGSGQIGGDPSYWNDIPCVRLPKCFVCGRVTRDSTSYIGADSSSLVTTQSSNSPRSRIKPEYSMLSIPLESTVVVTDEKKDPQEASNSWVYIAMSIAYVIVCVILFVEIFYCWKMYQIILLFPWCKVQSGRATTNNADIELNNAVDQSVAISLETKPTSSTPNVRAQTVKTDSQKNK